MIVTFPDAELAAAVGPTDGVDAVLWDLTSASETPESAEVVVAPYLGARAVLPRVAELSRCRFVQLQSAGYDGVLDVLPERIAVANAVGVYDSGTAEIAVGLILASLRGIPDAVVGKEQGRWVDLGQREALAGKRVLIVGYGAIGTAIARRLAPFEVSISAVASKPRHGDDLVAAVHGIDELHELLADHDVVVLVTPLTEATAGLADEAFMKSMPDGALLVNVARGPVVDTQAVLGHADRLRFGLDVTDPEPLPRGHPLWDQPSVLITPHLGGNTTARLPPMVSLIRDQLSRLTRGESPLHLVRVSARW